MKKTTLPIFLIISSFLILFLSCKEEFPKDEIIGNWQIDKFQCISPDTLVTSDIDSFFNHLAVDFGWYNIAIKEDLSLDYKSITGDSAQGNWERLSFYKVRLWVNGASIEWRRVNVDNYYHDDYQNDMWVQRVFWKRKN